MGVWSHWDGSQHLSDHGCRAHWFGNSRETREEMLFNPKHFEHVLAYTHVIENRPPKTLDINLQIAI